MAQQGEIGFRLNEWRPPIFETGPQEHDLERLIQQKINNINIPTRTWESHCKTVDTVLRIILREFKRVASTNYPGLHIADDIIRQGSSREGLKVFAADEYDCIIPFQIEGLRVQYVPVKGRDGNIVPGLLKMHVQNAAQLEEKCPWIRQREIIDPSGVLNTMQIQKILFTSILDKALSKINQCLEQETRYKYRVRRSVNPTNLQLTVEFEGEGSFGAMRGIFRDTIPESLSFIPQSLSFNQSGIGDHVQIRTLDIDFVPGMLIGRDHVPDPYTVRSPQQYSMTCERYAVMKWLNKKNPNILEEDHTVLWRNSTSGYEKHIMDVGRRSPSQRYILTACRILKAYMSKEKGTRSNNQLPRLVKSYFVKNICLFCIVFLAVPSAACKLSGVREALGYIVAYLEASLKARCLPHFFHGNPWLSAMFPGCYFEQEMTKSNLLPEADSELMTQAALGVEPMKAALNGLFLDKCYLDPDKCALFEDMLHK